MTFSGRVTVRMQLTWFSDLVAGIGIVLLGVGQGGQVAVDHLAAVEAVAAVITVKSAA